MIDEWILPQGSAHTGAWILGFVACGWMWLARRRFMGGARELTERERTEMGLHFSNEMLGRVRVAEMERIELPLTRMANRLLGRGDLLGSPRGIALANLVVVTREKVASGSESRGTRAGLLFHELVHVAQYERLGVRGFLTAYLRGWLENDRDYFSIPLEVQAYELQRRFECGKLEAGDVGRAVDGSTGDAGVVDPQDRGNKEGSPDGRAPAGGE